MFSTASTETAHKGETIKVRIIRKILALIGLQKDHSWLFAQRKVKNVIFAFLTNQ